MFDQVQLKQRIVGGIVLVALAIILVPFLMDDPRQEVKILESNVDPWPEDPPLNLIEIQEEEFSPIVEPIAQSPVAPVKPASQPKSAPAKGQAETAAKPKAGSKKASGKRWEVQVVSYGRKSRKRAERFLKRMKDKGYTVTLKETKRTLKLVTQSVGSEKEAKALKKKIDRDFKVDKVNAMVRLLK